MCPSLIDANCQLNGVMQRWSGMTSYCRRGARRFADVTAGACARLPRTPNIVVTSIARWRRLYGGPADASWTAGTVERCGGRRRGTGQRRRRRARWRLDDRRRRRDRNSARCRTIPKIKLRRRRGRLVDHRTDLIIALVSPHGLTDRHRKRR